MEASSAQGKGALVFYLGPGLKITMELTIHRGTHEIGGSCVELKTEKTRLLIDFGIPLVTPEREPFDSKTLVGRSIDELKETGDLPRIEGLYKNEAKSIDAVLISHSHLGPYGFLQYVNPEIPIYLSKGAELLIEISDIFLPAKVGKLNTGTIKDKRQFKVGDLMITPFLVDPSAFDAMAFLVEADGKRLFYSGDFRGHGRKAALFKRMVENPPKDIDCLLMEGSTLGREDTLYKTEEEVQHRIEDILKERKNITFLSASSQNIDRIVSAYKACRRTGSIFVMDIYTAFILDKLRKVSKNIPQFDWKDVRVKFWPAHAEALAKAGYRDLLYVYNKRKIDTFELARKRSKVLMVARNNHDFPRLLKEIGEVQGAKIVYSMWEGYLTDTFRQFCAERGLVIEQVRTSGHAGIEDLKAFANALNPKTLIPIHTFESSKYPGLFEKVRVLKDGEALDL